MSWSYVIYVGRESILHKSSIRCPFDLLCWTCFCIAIKSTNASRNKWLFIHLKLYNYIFIGKYFLHLIIGFQDWFVHTRNVFPQRRFRYIYLFFSEASQRSGILNPWIWLANSARSSGPDFPIRTPCTDRSEQSPTFAAILAAFCYTKNLHEM